jgi:SAM-dependent methyltransferase
MFKRLKARNFRRPAGLIGRYLIRTLKKNQIEYDEMASLLDPDKDDIVLEIGYGLGYGIYDYVKKYGCTIHGIDFSRLMYRKARRLNRENIRHGKAILYCDSFEDHDFQDDMFDAVYFLNVINFWDDVSVRFRKIYSLLKQNGKVIIFMADAGYFSSTSAAEGETIYYLYNISNIIAEMGKTGFKSIVTKEHTSEKKCYYITGYKL